MLHITYYSTKYFGFLFTLLGIYSKVNSQRGLQVLLGQWTSNTSTDGVANLNRQKTNNDVWQLVNNFNVYWKFLDNLAKMSGYKRVNFYELCRLCASNQQKEKTHIFHEEGKKIQLQNKIQSCLSLTVRTTAKQNAPRVFYLFLTTVICL